MSGLPEGVVALTAALAKKSLSSVEATRQFLQRIDEQNPRLHAFIHVARDSALAAARQSDTRRSQGRSLGPLDGVPIAAKDNIDVSGIASSGGIEHYRNAIAMKDAFVIEQLRAAGAVIVGKLNMHEAALGATNDNPWFGRCENPLRAGFTPGGSSGGSGSAVAAGLCAAALGSDTLGSVRIPAAYCGVTGFKPTYGLLSTRGVMPISWTLDHVGFLAPRVADLEMLVAASARYDAGWPFARSMPNAPRPLRNRDAVAGLRVGRIARFEHIDIEPEVLAAYADSIEALTRAGTQIVDVSLSGYEYTRVRRECLLLIEMEGAAVHGDAVAKNPAGFSAELRSMLAFGAKQSGARAALSYRRLIEARALLAAAFAQTDIVVLPTAPQVAFAFGDPVPANQADLTGLANILESPSGCVPWGVGRNGLPASVQVVGHPFADALVLDVMRVIEALAPSLK